MNRYIKGIGSIWVGPDTPPSNATNCLWLKQTKDTLSSYQLLYYNINKSLGRWETVTPGYLLFDNLRGIATPSPEFFPIESNDYLAYIGAGKGEYTNFIQDNGKPIVIESDSSIVLLYKEKDSSYWTYKEVECKGPQGLSAYDSAVLGGYSNTLDQFYLDLASIGNKVDKIPGKGLSTNDYTDQDKFQVNTINNKVNRNELTEVAFSGKHKDLLDTTEVDCHPIQSITGLQEELDFLKGSGRFAHLDENNKVIETANNSDKLNNKSESELEVKLAQQAIADQDGNRFTTTYLKKTDLPKIIKNVEYNNSNGSWIFTFVDETTYNVDQPIENIIQSVKYTKDTKTLTITMWNNQVFNTILDIPTAIYTPEETDSILISIVGDKISAIVKDYISKTEVNTLLKTKVDQDDLGLLAYKNNINYSEVVNAPTKLSQFNNDIISEWALALSKPTYTWEEILNKPTQYTPAPHTHTVLDITNLSDNYLAKVLKGAPNGIAELDSTGKVPADQLPGFVDDVVEVDTYEDLPNPGVSSKIYITIDTNKQYRWGGTTYVPLGDSLALGTTSETAGRGDWTQAAYNHSLIIDGSNPHKTTYSSLLDAPTSLPANGGNAESAVKDGDGNVITTNYFKLAPTKVSDLNDAPLNSFFVSINNPLNSPVTYASFVNGFTIAADNNITFKRQFAYADSWYYRTQGNNTWGAWIKMLDSGNFNPSDYISFNNTTEYTPTSQYNPATKGYVDSLATTYILDMDNILDYMSSSGSTPISQDNLQTLHSIRLLILDNQIPRVFGKSTAEEGDVLNGCSTFLSWQLTIGALLKEIPDAVFLSFTCITGSYPYINLRGTSVIVQADDSILGFEDSGWVQIGGSSTDIIATKIKDIADNTNKQIWTGTQAQFDQIVTKDSNVIYLITA